MALVVEYPPEVQDLKRKVPTSGLYPLELLNQVYLTEVLEEYQPITGWEECKRYTITDGQDIKLFSTVEQNPDLFNKVIAKSRRAFEISVQNTDSQEVMKFVRNYKNHGFSLNIVGFDFRNEKVAIMDSSGAVLGSGCQKSKNPVSPPDFQILNSREEVKLMLRSPMNPLLSTSPYLFEIEDVDTRQIVGMITRIYPGNFLQNFLRHPRKFDIRFPSELDVSLKASILGALVLADFMFFE